jgi:site-specific DNA recombinase
LTIEQQRISADIDATNTALSGHVSDMTRVEATIRKASAWASNCHQAYLRAEPTERKLINQAFFSRILVTEDGVVGWEYNEPFALLMAAHGATTGRGLQIVTTNSADRTAPVSGTTVATHRASKPHSHRGGYERTSPSLLARAYSLSSLKATSPWRRGWDLNPRTTLRWSPH